MKYGYEALKGKCKSCLFKCGRVEDINFNGIERCIYYTEEEADEQILQQESGNRWSQIR